MVLGDSTLESLTPSVNAPLDAHAEGAARGHIEILAKLNCKYGTFEESISSKVESATPQWKEEYPLGAHFRFPIHTHFASLGGHPLFLFTQACIHSLLVLSTLPICMIIELSLVHQIA